MSLYCYRSNVQVHLASKDYKEKKPNAKRFVFHGNEGAVLNYWMYFFGFSRLLELRMVYAKWKGVLQWDEHWDVRISQRVVGDFNEKFNSF